MDHLAIAGGNFCTSKAALAAGTTTTFSTTGATLYAIKGKAYSTNAASNSATPTTDGNTGSAFTAVGANKGSVYVFAYDGSSTTAATAIKVYQGSIEALDGATDGANAKFLKAPQFPVVPDSATPFGYLVVKVGASGSNWTFGSSNLSSVSNVSFAFQDVMVMPSRPQVS